MNPNIIKKANDIVNSCTEGYVAVINEDGYPHVATRSNIKPNGMISCYFSTDTHGDMAQSIMKNSKASVCFHSNADNITLVGTAEIVDDMDIKKELWVDWFINHFPKGVKDPEYCIIKFTTEYASLYVDKTVSKFSISYINKPQSRCGLMCDSCTFKEPCNCGGCIETNGHPFHGECPIAICCQDKGYVHCGQCKDMPCDKLYEYSCGEGDHCDNPKGARLEMLKYWSAND